MNIQKRPSITSRLTTFIAEYKSSNPRINQILALAIPVTLIVGALLVYPTMFPSDFQGSAEQNHTLTWTMANGGTPDTAKILRKLP